MAEADSDVEVPDLVTLDVPVGGRVLVVSDLRLDRVATVSSTAAAAELAQVVDSWTGPGVLIFAGNLFELLAAPPPGNDPATALAAHGRLDDALTRFVRAGRRVVCLPGSRDGRLAWDARQRSQLCAHMGASVALSAEVRLATGGGEDVVRVLPGHVFDTRNAPRDPRSMVDTPLGHHLVEEVAPALGQARTTWLGGMDRLASDAQFPRLVASRLLYRRAVRYAWLLLVPVFVALSLKLPLTYTIAGRRDRALGPWPHRLLVLGVAAVIDVLALLGGAAFVLRRSWRATAAVLGRHGREENDLPRAEARRLITSGHRGLITGHTRHAELVRLGDGFYANAGCATEVVDERSARLGLPPVYLPYREVSWVELEAGAELHVRLLHARTEVTGGTVLERLVASPLRGPEGKPVVVSSFPHGEPWPPLVDPLLRLKRVRRAGGAIIAVAGLLNLASALTPPLRDRFEIVRDIVPLAVPQVATVLVALAGVGLLVLGRGVRRGQRRAWRVALLLLLGSVVLHVVKAVDLEEAGVALAAALYLLLNRRAFGAVSEPLSSVSSIMRSLTFRPVRRVRTDESDRERARGFVTRFGHDTLDYFALRSDKDFFFAAHSMVAYAIHGGVCLVSPDPIGPASERGEVWAAFRRFVDDHGWDLGVLGAGEEWLPIYRSSGMHDLYVGDEAVVNLATFSLDGGENKSLRQAVNRVAKYGYTMSFHDPVALPDALRAGLEEVMVQSRRGGVERGFSMTLGRVFDPADEGLLLAVCHAPSPDGSGKPVAFCQFVPAPGIDGYSLDLMRRDKGEHPNGLLDFVVVETIRHLRELGRSHLGLNFATMRAVLAGEAGESLTQRVERWALRRMSGSMQIESLWRFNAKFDPTWLPRYAVYDSLEHVVPIALAIARAESFWELPIIGRFLTPSTPAPAIASSSAQAP